MRGICSRANNTILGDPGAYCGGKGKSKPAKENGDEDKNSRARRAPGDTFLPDQFQTVEVILDFDRVSELSMYYVMLL